MNTQIQIGSQVERKGSLKDYTTGRRGTVEEINQDRIRVRWLFEKDGKPVLTPGHKPNTGRGVRTWVNKKFIKLLNHDHRRNQIQIVLL